MRAVRHDPQIGWLPEPERDASGYRSYGATDVVRLIKVRTLAQAGVPLSRDAEPVVEFDPRGERLLTLLGERGWTGWTGLSGSD